MDTAAAVALAQLLSQLLPLGISAYTQIQQANQDQLKPIEEVLAAADGNWDEIVKAAKAELAKTPGA